VLAVGYAQYNVSCSPIGSLHDFNTTYINGTLVQFSDYAGQVLMIANVASF